MVAVLFAPSFHLQAALRSCPDRARRPVGLVASDQPHAPLIQLTRAARRAGVEPGLTPTQALARCPNLEIVPRDQHAETVVQSLLLDRSQRMAPLVENTGPGQVTLDVSTLGRVRDWEAWLHDLTAHLPGITARAGLGRNPWVAGLAAEQGRPCHIVPPGTEKSFLATIPISRAGIDPSRLDVLHLWGIATFGDLAALGRPSLVARWGKEGGALWDQATGRMDRPLIPFEEPSRWIEARDLETPVETLEPLLFILRRFLDLLLARLAERMQGISRLVLTLNLTNGTHLNSSLDLPEPTRDATRLFRVLHQHVEGIRSEAPVIAVQLEAFPGHPPERQPDFFVSSLKREDGFRETLARLMALVGSDRVGVPVLEETHQPDRFHLEHRAPSPSEPQPGDIQPALVLRRFRPPVPAQVRLGKTGPSAFIGEAFDEEIVQTRGPWRSSGHWWQPDRAWQREEWDVETRNGQLFRLVRQGDTWTVEGMYD